EELALVQTQHVRAELRVLEATPGAMHLAVGDAHDAAPDVAVLVRTLVEAPRQVRLEERRADVLVAIELDRRGELGQKSGVVHGGSSPQATTWIAPVGQLRTTSASDTRSARSEERRVGKEEETTCGSDQVK